MEEKTLRRTRAQANDLARTHAGRAQDSSFIGLLRDLV